MDNNQQVAGSGTEQPAASTPVTEQAGPDGGKVSPAVSNLGVNNPSTMGVGSPLSGKDASMTTGQYAGGKIRTTEIGSVS
jgi:hypothetical protein